MRRLTLFLATALVVGTVVSSAGIASAGTHVKPVLTATQASFAIPSTPTGVWRLTLTTWPPPNQKLGQTSGTSGTLTLPVPQTANCQIQADVAFQAGGSGPFVFYSGTKHVLPGCGQSGSGQRFTPGYWKNHGTATSKLLPLTLGNYTVDTFDKAKAILSGMGCGSVGVENCMAGMLLATELNLAQGGAKLPCALQAVADANALLVKYHYSGSGSTPSPALSSADAATMMTLHDALSNYSQDGVPSSC